MKKTILILVVLISLFQTTHAQGEKYRVAKNYYIKKGYSIGQEWYNDLEQGQYFTKSFSFENNAEYAVVALSEDNDVRDVDIEILTAAGDIYEKDTQVDALAIVSFTPSFTRNLTIKVLNYRSRTPDYASRVYFFVAYRK